jgi:hypothetical protein
MEHHHFDQCIMILNSPVSNNDYLQTYLIPLVAIVRGAAFVSIQWQQLLKQRDAINFRELDDCKLQNI